MTQKHFVQLKLGSKIYQPARVSAESCESVYDFLSAIKTTTFSRVLKQYDVAELVLFEADGTTKISAMDSINQLDEKKMPLVAVVEPVEVQVEAVEKPAIKSLRSKPEPKPQFKNRYKRLNDFYTTDEWNILEELNNAVNPKLHSVLPVLFDGHSKEVILPIEVSHLDQGIKELQKVKRRV
ncbi:hypothetical protein BSLG_006014 [Batrachochytrium salamandrivorans]|nr:hypothetical protein BSLG_006014 [Batrachochytrium salamandrivorans]